MLAIMSEQLLGKDRAVWMHAVHPQGIFAPRGAWPYMQSPEAWDRRLVPVADTQAYVKPELLVSSSCLVVVFCMAFVGS